MDNYKKYIDQLGINVSDVFNVPESFSSEVYSLLLKNGEKVILKIPYNKSKLLREYKMLELLKDKLPVPKVLDFFEGNENLKGALLLSYIDGNPIIGEIDKKLAYDMGELLAKLHVVPMKYYQLTEDNTKDWWISIKTRFKEWTKECENGMTPHMLNKCIKVFEKMYKDLPTPDGPCVIHFDYRPGNILTKNNEIKGLIDFESSRGGSSDIDFTKSKLYVWDKYIGTKEAFINGYKSIRPLPDIEKTLPFYLFYNGFGGVAWCVRRNELNGEFMKENMEQIKEIIKNY